MEPILENTCEYSEALLAEGIRVQMQEAQRRKNLLLYAALVLLGLLGLYFWLFRHQEKYLLYCIIILVLFIATVITNRITPRRVARVQVPKIREKNGGLTFHTQFFDDHVTILSPTGTQTEELAYSRLGKMIRTEHLIVLLTRENQMLLLDPARFERGTETDFMALGREHFPALLPREKAHG